MKICLINNLYKPFNRGGAESVVELTARGLINAGYEVFIITTKSLLEKFKIYPECSEQKIKIYYINSLYYNLNKLPLFLRLFWHIIDMFDLGSCLKIKSILKKEKPNLVITNNLKGMTYLIPHLIKRRKIKHIHILHDIQLLHPSGLMIFNKERLISGFFAIIYQNICRWLFNSPQIVISPSFWLMKIHTSKEFFQKSKKIILPNPVYCADNRKIDLTKKNNNEFIFLYVGQIEEHKGILFLIKTFQILKSLKSESRAKLFIIGDGSLIEKARQLTKGNEDIIFLGRVGNEDVQKNMLKADAFIIPSLCYENSPKVIYEAFSCGLPVLGADLGGIAELLANNRGILFKPDNQDDLILKLQWMMHNKSGLAKISEAARQIAANCDLNNYLKTLLNLM